MTFSELISGTVEHHEKYHSRKGVKITRVIQHHWATNTMAGEQTLANPNRKASATYLVYNDGTIKGQVPEEFRPWTSGSALADNSSITIECQNERNAPDWKISDAAENSIVKLLADIAERHEGIETYNEKNYVGHKNFAATACPGPYLSARLGAIRSEANALIVGGTAPDAPAPAPAPAPMPPAAPAVPELRLKEDGEWGGRTTWWMQSAAGTTQDSVISHQWKSEANQYLFSAQFDKTKIGSELAYWIQRRLASFGLMKSKPDGLIGADTIDGLEIYYGTAPHGVPDHKLSLPSETVRKIQVEINHGSFLGIRLQH